jgi:hypothetical protein
LTVEKGEQSASHPGDLTPQKQCWMAPETVQSLSRKVKCRDPTGNRTPIIIQEDITLKNITVTDSYEILHFEPTLTHPFQTVAG